MAHGYYIIAERGNDGAYRLPLLGPFKLMGTALKMLDPVTAAVQRTRPDLADCYIVPRALSVPGKLPRGKLDLAQAVDQAWIDHCMGGWRR